MTELDRDRLRKIKTFPQLVEYLRDDLGWPMENYKYDDLIFDYDPEELGIDPKNAVKIEEIQQLRPLVMNQPWGIFFVKFGKNRLSVVALRRILSQLVIKKRASMRKAEQPSWHLHDLLFVSNFCEDNERKITFAQFTQNVEINDLPTLKVLGWDEGDTGLYMDHVQRELKDKLRWPKNENDAAAWRDQWSSAFTLRHHEVITTSKDLAVRLADLAKKIRDRALQVLAIESERGRLRKLHKAFREALIHDLSEEDFADMYAQTIAYGLLAARVSRPMGITADNIVDMVPPTNPFLKEMLGVFLKIGGRKGGIDFDELGVQDVVDLLKATNMEAVLRDFGNRTRQEDPVIHFYELFLKEYDQKKKVERGVFYTPQPVVSYIVRSVHELLQTEFGLEDGLASTITWGEMIKKNPDLKLPILKPKIPDDKKSEDTTISPDEPFVTILDPATGTATFLVEAIDIIHNTMTTKWEKEGLKPQQISQKWNEYIPQHLLPRLYGFELMMAPYAIAHMKIGLKLHETGYDFKTDERVRVYLTNSLEPASDSVQRDLTYYSEALAHEATAVNEVKKNKRYTTLMGNPPYSNFGMMNTGDWILTLIDDYKKGLKEKKLNLDDDFVKFIRFAQFKIQESQTGIFAFITNNTYLDGITHRQMRQYLLQTYNDLFILDLHGNSRRGEVAPNGVKDKNVFDIQQGVAISIFSKRQGEFSPSSIHHADLWGSEDVKYNFLETYTCKTTNWLILNLAENKFFFVPKSFSLSKEYNSFWRLTDVFSLWQNAIKTDRDELFFDFDSKMLKNRMKIFYSKEGLNKHFSETYRVENSSSYDLINKRSKTSFSEKNIYRCLYRPFDWRWLYYMPGLTSRPAWDVMCHIINRQNMGILTSRQVLSDFKHVFVCSTLANINGIDTAGRFGSGPFFPLYIYNKDRNPSTLLTDNKKTIRDNRKLPNLSSVFVKNVQENIGLLFESNGKGDLNKTFSTEDLFNFIYSIFHSPTYRSHYAEFLKIDFPRVPLPGSLDLFKELVPLGDELVALHLMESPKLNKPITKYTGTTPSGEIEKITYSDNTVWIDKAQSQGFRGVPENVWNFYIGGYQVCDKWLKDRKGRQLSAEDIAHYQKIIVALNETIRIMVEIDKVIEKHGGWPGAFDTSGTGAEVVTGVGEQQTLFDGGENT